MEYSSDHNVSRPPKRWTVQLTLIQFKFWIFLDVTFILHGTFLASQIESFSSTQYTPLYKNEQI